MTHTPTLIIGAGPAGLACGARLSRAGLDFEILERADAVGASWRAHYERLRLHTERRHSGLPLLPMPSHYPKYPSREQVVSYLEDYAKHFGLAPRFGQQVDRASREDGVWVVQTQDARWTADHLVVATGYNAVPHEPAFPGRDEFAGDVMHSADYKSGAPWSGKRAVVIGCGNSGGEIAIDLVEHGADVSWVVRGPVHVVPRDVLGRSAQELAILLGRFPADVVDRVTRPIQRLMVGDLSRYGIRKPREGMYAMVRKYGRIPILDIGTIRLVKQGRIQVLPGVRGFTPRGLKLVDGRVAEADVVVLATGFKAGLHEFLDGAERVTDRRGYPLTHGRESSLPGLFFIGYRNPASGNIREMGFESERIAEAIAGRVRRSA